MTSRRVRLREGPFTPDEQRSILDLCPTDVDALARLLPRMADRIDLAGALLRGQYMAAVVRRYGPGRRSTMSS